jgi:hypothetical protein
LRSATIGSHRGAGLSSSAVPWQRCDVAAGAHQIGLDQRAPGRYQCVRQGTMGRLERRQQSASGGTEGRLREKLPLGLQVCRTSIKRQRLADQPLQHNGDCRPGMNRKTQLGAKARCFCSASWAQPPAVRRHRALGNGDRPPGPRWPVRHHPASDGPRRTGPQPLAQPGSRYYIAATGAKFGQAGVRSLQCGLPYRCLVGFSWRWLLVLTAVPLAAMSRCTWRRRPASW